MSWNPLHWFLHWFKKTAPVRVVLQPRTDTINLKAIYHLVHAQKRLEELSQLKGDTSEEKGVRRELNRAVNRRLSQVAELGLHVKADLKHVEAAIKSLT